KQVQKHQDCSYSSPRKTEITAKLVARADGAAAPKSRFGRTPIVAPQCPSCATGRVPGPMSGASSESALRPLWEVRTFGAVRTLREVQTLREVRPLREVRTWREARPVRGVGTWGRAGHARAER